MKNPWIEMKVVVHDGRYYTEDGKELHMNMKKAKTRKQAMPKYTGLKDFAQGVQKLYNLHGNIPVFLEVAGHFAPFGIAVQCSELLGGEAMVFKGGLPNDPHAFTKGDVTE